MCRKMKSIADLFNFLQYIYHGIKCDKTRKFVHGKAWEVQHKIYQF